MVENILNKENINKIKDIRPFCNSIDEESRILPYALEAEREWLIPILGANLYKKILTEIDGETTKTYNDLLNGGFYDEDKSFQEGLYKTIAYLTYSRMARNQNVTVSQMNVLEMEDDISQKSSEETLLRISKDSEKIGLKYLFHCKKYCLFMGFIESEKEQEKEDKIKQNSKIRIIGD